MTVRRTIVLCLLTIGFPTAAAVAQPIGTFRWQIQPYCNVITVNVTQQGGIYQLDGTDDRCGGGNQPGSAVGIAYLTPLGLVGFGISSVLPNGTPIHTEATISIASLNGTWRDSAGNNGNFIFTPGAGVAGAPRPIPSGGIAANSITAVQIAAGAVGATQLAANSVTGGHIEDGSITSLDLGAAAVGATQIAAGAVGATQLAANSVTGGHIANGSITTLDLLDGPRIAFVGGEQPDINLTGVDTIVRSVTIIAPAAGKVMVNASGYFHFSNGATSDGGRCEISTGTVISFNQLILTSEIAGDSIDFAAFAGTRGFDVAAGSHTFNLVCDASAGTAAVADTNMTAIFAATP